MSAQPISHVAAEQADLDPTNAPRANTVYFDVDGTNDEHLTIEVPADGFKHPVSALKCTDRATGKTLSGCGNVKVKYLPPSDWAETYCCNIDWNQCFKQGDILGPGFVIDPAQSMDLIRCQATTGGVCGEWKHSRLHNECK